MKRMDLNRLDAGKAGTTHVNFSCQKCGQPLKLDHSFNNGLDQQTYQEFIAPPVNQTEASEVTLNLVSQIDDVPTPDDEVSRKIIKPIRLISTESGNSGNNGFTLLASPDSNTQENISHRLRVMSSLFDAMSGQSDIDHPLCEECTDVLLDQLDAQLELTEQECKEYRDFLEKLSLHDEEVDEASLDVELAQLRQEEATLHEQLENLETERLVLKEQMDIQRKEARRLEEEDDKYWKSYNEYKRQLLDLEDSQKGVDNQLRYAQAHLDRLKKTNAFNATFHIWHSGHFGTINNFRLGRLPSVPVEWNEINAAWGQTVLLLHSLAKKMDLTFQRYRLVPYGSHSFLESLSEKHKELPLYGSGGIRFFWDTKFDHAMVAFLDCLQQFKEEVEKGDTGFCLPYKMERGKIEDSSTGQSYSIKIQFNSEEQWTKALKFMLTNLKWGLAWVSSQFAAK